MSAENENRDLEERLRAARTTQPLEALPEEAHQRALRLFRLQFPPREGVVVRLARLVQDSFRTPLAPALVRGAALSELREQLFSVGELSLRLVQEGSEREGQWYVIGQLRGEEGVGVTGIAASLETPTRRFTAQELGQGELHFEAVPAGRYVLRLALREPVEIVVPEVPIGEV